MCFLESCLPTRIDSFVFWSPKVKLKRLEKEPSMMCISTCHKEKTTIAMLSEFQ